MCVCVCAHVLRCAKCVSFKIESLSKYPTSLDALTSYFKKLIKRGGNLYLGSSPTIGF